MKVAIVDDEVHCIESLVIHLNDLFPDAEIVYKSNNVREAATQLGKLDIELLFLDVEMPGLNGFQLLEQFPNRKFDVIFATAYSQYAVEAFKAKAINYLLKPIDEKELKEVIKEWKEDKAQAKDSKGQLNQLLSYLKKEGALKSKIAVPISDGFEFVEIDNIMYCQSQSNYTILTLSNGNELMISKTLKGVEATLQPFFFIRIHQSFLVNPNHIKSFHRKEGGSITMQDDKKIPVSSKKRKMLIDLFEAIQKQ